jgi:hypothetical protein
MPSHHRSGMRAATAAGLGVLTLLAACSTSSGNAGPLEAVNLHGRFFQYTQAYAMPGRLYTFDIAELCDSGDGPIRITRVELLNPGSKGSMRIVRFSLRNGRRVLTPQSAPCSDHGGRDLEVSVELEHGKRASAQAFRIESDHNSVVTNSSNLALCRAPVCHPVSH